MGGDNDPEDRLSGALDKFSACSRKRFRPYSSVGEGDESKSAGMHANDEPLRGIEGTANSISQPVSSSKSSLPAENEDLEEASDDEPEILLVIQPTPTRNQAQSLPPTAMSDTTHDEKARSVVTPTTNSSMDQESNDTETSSGDSSRGYSYRSSAYVQTLAEMCYTILWDQRWRVGRRSEPLFAWERGDDLSAVTTLSRLFIRSERRSKEKGRKLCALCRLCRSQATPKEGSSHEQARTAKAGHEETSGTEGLPTESAANGKGVSTSEITAEQEEHHRVIHLYSRLFYRKGPWFRLDDLYNRYYKKKRKKVVDNSTKDDIASVRKYAETSQSGQEEAVPETLKNDNRSHDNVSDCDGITIEETLQSLSCLAKDVARLLEMGLVRTFADEEECGKTVGAVSDEGTGVLLAADERRNLLTQLGGGPNKKRKPLGWSPSKVPNDDRSDDNLIWKQMRRQKSILGLNNSTDKKVLLPVRRRVHELMLEKLATNIVMSSCSGFSLPRSVLRERVSALKRSIAAIFSQELGESKSTSGAVFCICLRESPVKTLRRCVRLYLCASAGPGNMRGDGTNGWLSVLDNSRFRAPRKDVPFLKDIQVSGSRTWHNIVYPSLHHRFGISTCSFTESYRSLSLGEGTRCNDGELEGEQIPWDSEVWLNTQVFTRTAEFDAWELCAEIRANIDYLIEANDLIHYQERRVARESAARYQKDGASPLKQGASTRKQGDFSASQRSDDQAAAASDCRDFDFLSLQHANRRAQLIVDLLRNGSGLMNNLGGRVDQVVQDVEKEIKSFDGKETNESAIPVEYEGDSSDSQQVESTSESMSKSEEATSFENDCERIIAIISIVATYVLIAHHKMASKEEVSRKESRPWLRHMWWDGNLAYILWDCVPLLEKRGCYELASKALEVLLFGSAREEQWIGTATSASMTSLPYSSFAVLLISRRARGKAYERLIIDYVHRLRAFKKLETENNSAKRPAKRARKKGREKSTSPPPTPPDVIVSLCAQALQSSVPTGLIPFAAIRSLARKMKRPLTESLNQVWCMEVSELGLRLDNQATPQTKEADNTGKKSSRTSYRDWTPITDYAVANSLDGESSSAGGRCSFIGFEEGGEDWLAFKSLNVEELAMQFYATGRLPQIDDASTNDPKGGWLGWHDEGGHVRALFRILCSSTLLQADGCCGNHEIDGTEDWENLTIFLTPYQGAPFDLHVGHTLTSEADEGNGTVDGFVRSFYGRRRERIDFFLSKLESLERQELCDLVYDSVIDRFKSARSISPMVERDLRQVRTMSMLAAGLGGKLLSAVFRCLVFDYRHYSGGLPDLLLVRALSEDGATKRLVDIGEWVGEAFSPESVRAEEQDQRLSLFVDMNDEFLGCSKLGDSAGQAGARWRGGSKRKSNRRQVDPSAATELGMSNLPPKLFLSHEGEKVQVECLFVEVKSSNDRLDPRQEDWLNVLDRHGKARVCKFESTTKKGKLSKRSDENNKID